MTSDDETPKRSTVRSVERALDLLDILERSETPLRLTDLARRSELHPATTLRLLGVLQYRGLIAADGADYRVAAGGLGLGHAYLRTDPLINRARPILQQLAATTGFTASLYVRTGQERILAVRVDGKDPFRYQLPLGRRLPLHMGGGKSILAFLDDETRDAIIDEAGAGTDTHGEPISRETLLESLATIRKNGYHLSIAERDTATAAISVPIHASSGAIVGAIAVSGPVESTTAEDLIRQVSELSRAARAVGA